MYGFLCIEGVYITCLQVLLKVVRYSEGLLRNIGFRDFASPVIVNTIIFILLNHVVLLSFLAMANYRLIMFHKDGRKSGTWQRRRRTLNVFNVDMLREGVSYLSRLAGVFLFVCWNQCFGINSLKSTLRINRISCHVSLHG